MIDYELIRSLRDKSDVELEQMRLEATAAEDKSLLIAILDEMRHRIIWGTNG